MFEVAFSRRMCCSRVARVSQHAGLACLRLADQAPGNLPDEFLPRRDHPAERPAKARGNAERLRFHADDVGLGRRLHESEGNRLRESRRSAARPLLWTMSAIAATSSMVPKKFGDCIITAGGILVERRRPGWRNRCPRLAGIVEGRNPHALIMHIGGDDLAILGMNGARRRRT